VVRLWKLEPASSPPRRIVILDRDGVLNQDPGHVGHAHEFVWNEGAIEAVKWLNENGLGVVVATNQAGIAKGIYSERDFSHLMSWVQAELEGHGARLDGVYFCPHHPSEGGHPVACSCRKPAPGMLLEILADFEARPEDCVMIGDKPSDEAAADAAGIRAVLFTGGSLLATVRAAVRGWTEAPGDTPSRQGL